MTRPQLSKADHTARKQREHALCKQLWDEISMLADMRGKNVSDSDRTAEGWIRVKVKGKDCLFLAASLEEYVIKFGTHMGVIQHDTDYISRHVLDGFPPRGKPRQCYFNAFEAVVALQGNSEISAVRYCEGYAQQEGLPIAVHHAWVQLKLYGEKTWRIYDPTWPVDTKGLPRMVCYHGCAFDRTDVWAKMSEQKLWSGVLLDGSGEFFDAKAFTGLIRPINRLNDRIAQLPPPLPGR